jgi:hypothetical protein
MIVTLETATRIATIMLFGAALSIASAEDKEIGKVRDIAGGWCRKAARLKKADTLKLEDEVRYCSTPYSRQDYIVIDFPGEKGGYVYTRTYKCSTPGICDQHAKLWLEGAYRFRRALDEDRYLYVEVLLSRPVLSYPPSLPSEEERRRRAEEERELASLPVFPDVVISTGQGGATLPANIVTVVAHEDIVLSHMPSARPTVRFPQYGLDDPRNSLTSDYRYRQTLTKLNPKIDVKPGLYGVYRVPVPQSSFSWPNALWLVTSPGSRLPARWNDLPEAFRSSQEEEIVQERRLFLLDLFKSEME